MPKRHPCSCRIRVTGSSSRMLATRTRTPDFSQPVVATLFTLANVTLKLKKWWKWQWNARQTSGTSKYRAHIQIEFWVLFVIACHISSWSRTIEIKTPTQKKTIYVHQVARFTTSALARGNGVDVSSPSSPCPAVPSSSGRSGRRRQQKMARDRGTASKDMPWVGGGPKSNEASTSGAIWCDWGDWSLEMPSFGNKIVYLEKRVNKLEPYKHSW